MEKERKAPNPDKLPVGKFFAWKSRDVSLAAVTVIVSGYLAMYCTDTLGMSATAVGMLLMISKLFDGVTDLLVGYLVDNTNTKLGKGRPYEICIILEWICTFFLFFADESWAMTAKYVWVFVMYTMVYSIFNTFLNGNQTPYMVRAFSGNRKVITKVSSYGGMVSMLGSIIVSMLFPRAMASLVVEAQAGSAGWRELMALFAIPLAVIGILRFIFVKEDPSVDAGQSSEKIKVKEIFVMLKGNKYAWFFAGIMGFYNLAIGLGAGSYYFTYIVGNISLFGVVSALGVILLPVMIFFPALMRKLKVSNLFEISAVLAIVGYLLVFVAKDNVTILFVGIIISTIMSLPISYLQVLCIMDLATYNEYKGLHRMEGTTGVVAGFAAKAFGGIGTGLTGILLGAAGFVEGTGGNAAMQPESAMLMIRSLYSLIPLICAVIILLCAFAFGRLEKQIPQMETEIKARKQGA